MLAALEVHGEDPQDPVVAVARTLGRPEEEVRDVVDALVVTGGLVWLDGRPVVPPKRRVHTGVDAARHAELARHWAEVATALEAPFVARGYVVVSIGESDLQRLFALHRRVHADTVELVARSGAERVVAISLQTAALDGLPLPPRAVPGNTSRRT
ncbi:MAG: hypothetical protein KC621_29560 [Myxococcales bacterium]|nr:hypothetical protein [Myxococcales bacterium]